MQRKALVVRDAGGPEEGVRGVLQRFGIPPAEVVASLADAVTRLRDDRFDLVIVPLQGTDGVERAAFEREVRRAPHTFVIGTAPSADPDTILQAMRSGVHEFLIHPPDPKDLAGAIDRLLRRSGGEVKRGVAVAVYGAKGGLGNTTVAVNLAYAFAKTRPDGRIAIADLVIGSGDVRVMLDLKPTYDLGDLAMKVDRIDADLLYSLLTQCTDAVWALPAAESPEVADLLDASASTAIVTQLRAHFAYTVLDCEHHLSDRTVAALDGADKIVLVTQLSVPALRSTQRTLQLCERLGYPSEKMCVVVNRFSNSDVLSPADAAQVLQHEIYWKLPNDYKNSAAALNKGVPVVAYDPATPLAVSYAQLAAKLGGVTSEGAVNANGRGESSRLGRLFGKVRK